MGIEDPRTSVSVKLTKIPNAECLCLQVTANFIEVCDNQNLKPVGFCSLLQGNSSRKRFPPWFTVFRTGFQNHTSSWFQYTKFFREYFCADCFVFCERIFQKIIIMKLTFATLSHVIRQPRQSICENSELSRFLIHFDDSSLKQGYVMANKLPLGVYDWPNPTPMRVWLCMTGNTYLGNFYQFHQNSKLPKIREKLHVAYQTICRGSPVTFKKPVNFHWFKKNIKIYLKRCPGTRNFSIEIKNHFIKSEQKWA